MAKKNSEYNDLQRERRKHVRVRIYAVTRYFCPSRNAEIGVQTQIADISEGGARLLTFIEGIPVDTIVQISFIMPDRENALISAEGRVCHTAFLEKDLYRSGIQFLKLKKKDRLIIHDFVKRHSPTQA